MTLTRSRRQLFANLAELLRGDLPENPSFLESESYWQDLIPLADLHKVVAALPSSLADLGVLQQIPSDVADLLNAVHDLNSERNRHITAQGLDVLSILEKSGVQGLPVKGLAYEIIGLHTPPGVRLFGDIDILVSKEEAARAFEILVGHGYSPASDASTSERFDHHLPLLRPPPESDLIAPVEVHFRLGRERHLHLLSPQKVIQAARENRLDDQVVQTPQPIDLLQHAVVHSGLQHQYLRRRTTRFRDVLDIGRLWDLVEHDGYRISDLPIVQHSRAAQYFGACLLLYGRQPDELGPIAKPSQRCHARLLQRQSIPEKARLENTILRNLEALALRPLSVVAKLARPECYRAIFNMIWSRAV